MRWTPPHTRMFGTAQQWRIQPLVGIACAFGVALSGCSSISRLNRSLDASWQVRAQSLPAVPVFDPSPPDSGGLAARLTDQPAAVRTPAVPSPLPAPVAEPFGWKTTGLSAGTRPFQIFQAGQNGFRSLVVGSVAGHDPLALELVAELARHLHANRAILGGFETTILKTLNPDGEASRTLLNDAGLYINHQFPDRLSVPDPGTGGTAEVTFLLQQLSQRKPRRVIHVRTVRGTQGVIAAGPGAQEAAREVAEWLNFRLIALPGDSVEGSLERCLAAPGNPEVITFGLPNSAIPGDLWMNYGDSLLNLLLADNLATRDIARRNHDRTSADLRNRDSKNSEKSVDPATP